MRPLLSVVAASLLLSGLCPLHAQDNPVNCEAFSSGFSTPEGCIDGTQPSSGPLPTDQWQVEEGDDLWPDEGFGPGFLLY